jgi:outer membrane usher protein
MRSNLLLPGALLAAAFLLAGALPARAVEMGRLSVLSSLGEPLNARIEILGLPPGEEDRVTARLATPGTFARAGIELEPAALGVRFGIETLGNRRYVALWTTTPITGAGLNIIVDLQWRTGRKLRAYRLYLDRAGRELMPELATADTLLPPHGEQPGSSAPPPSAAPRSAAVPAAAPASGTPRPIPLEVFINGARVGDWVLLDVGGVFHATDDALQEWRVLRAPDAIGAPYRGQLWYPLSAVPGYEAQFNAANQSLELKFSASAFATTRLTQPLAERIVVTPPLTSLFANYDLNYTHSAPRGAPSAGDLGLLGELGLSGRFGVLTNTFVGRNLAEDENLGQRSAHRLETTFTRDYPNDHTTLRLGDSSTPAGTWGRQVYFGGIQLGRNFALAPGFITQPIPVIQGQSSAPSTVELYINDALRQTSQVPSGPFTIDNYPLLTGSGQARLVVRDLLGRETVLVQNLFSSTYLLRQGLSDWSAQAGAVRENLGLESDNYGERFASGLFRYGFTNDFTLETQAEASSRLRGGGLGVSAALFGRMLGQAAVAGSRDDLAGSGRLWMLGAEQVTLRHGFTLRTEGATREYRRIGQNELLPSFKQQRLASYTYFSEGLGHLGFTYARVEQFDAQPITTYSANYSVLVGRRASLTFTATRVKGSGTLGDQDSTAVGVALLIPLDRRMSAAGSVTRREGRTDGYVSASKTLGAEAGTAWRALAGRREGEGYAEGGFYYQGSRGLATADVSASDQQQTVRLGAQGGLLWTDGEVFASRKLVDSFALVEVPGYPNVGVGFQSTVLARTDKHGRALVPRLMPYRTNSIRLDPSELPISAELDTIEMTAVPPARSGVKIAFPVRSGRGALITILLEDGQPAPAGAPLELVGDSKEFFVARRGQAFVTGLQAQNTLRLKWNDQGCTLQVAVPEGGKDEIARVGPFVCSGVTR